MRLRVDTITGDSFREAHVNGRVVVRYDYLTKNYEGDVGQQLVEKAQKNSPGVSLSDLIKEMVREVAYGKARLSLSEFVGCFKKNRIADVIASNFAQSLLVNVDLAYISNTKNPHFKVSDEIRFEAQTSVLKNILIFLDKYNLTAAETLFEFLCQQKAEWPMVDMGKLFEEEYEEVNSNGDVSVSTLKNKVSQKISSHIKRLASEAYLEKFNEDKRGFVMGFLMRRVIRYNSISRKMDFCRKEFFHLMEYLDGIGCTVNRIGAESLYDCLYSDSQEMGRYVRERAVNEVKFGVRSDLVGVDVLEKTDSEDCGEPLFFQEGFNVKDFYQRHIAPAIFKFYSSKLQRMLMVREPDLLHKLNDPNNLGIRNYTTSLLRYIGALVETANTDKNVFLTKVREVFGLNNNLIEENFSNQEVQEHFAYCFSKAEEMYRRNLRDALAYREDQEIRDRLVYPEEILKCRDLAVLLEWFLKPRVFKASFPKHMAVSDQEISFMCSVFLRDFLKVSKKLSSKVVMEAKKGRDMLERSFINALDIECRNSIVISFRLMEELDEDGAPLKEHKNELACVSSHVGSFLQGLDPRLSELAMESEGDEIYFHGKRYALLPIEHKNFKKVKMRVPIVPIKKNGKGEKMFGDKKFVEIECLIYTGDKHYIHVKDDIAELFSEDRGKEVSDKYRWLLVFSNKKDLDVFREFMYSSDAREFIKVDDLPEGRQFTNKMRKPERSGNSKKLKEQQNFAITKTFSFPSVVEVEEVGETSEKVLNKRMQVTTAVLETQCQGLEQVLRFYLSDYSNTGHKSFSAERAWPLLFQYFPPEYFGDEVKVFQSQGPKYKKGK
jgi:hypothetical protein